MDDTGDAETTSAILLDRYRVEGMLGEGGLGTVVKAFDTRLKRMVAIKTLKRGSYVADPDHFRALEERFAREAEAGSRMGSHPNLVGVHDLVIDAERTQYLILEYIPGGTLGERIARGALPLFDALRLTIDVARGLEAAHEMGLVHRDIKPANIFLASNERAKVGDFGIAQIDDISGRTRTTSGHPGTPLYMSPEQERMTAYLRPASDQYSLGLVLFEMLTGQIHKRVGTRQAALLLANQPPSVATLVTRMLAADPDDRYPSMSDVIRAIEIIERQQASAETEIPTRTGSVAAALDDKENLVATRYDTPRVGLQPGPPVLAYAPPPPAIPTGGRYSRRAILIGAGGLIVAAGTAGAAMAGLRKSGAVIATATVPVAAIAAAPTAQPTATPTLAPTATSVPAATATTPPVAPIIITAPPIIITATPLPTAIPTPTPLPTTAPPPTPPPPPTATPQPPPTPLPTVTPRPPTTAVRIAQTTSWTDSERRISLSYPQTWRATRDTSDQYNILELDSGDGVFFYISSFVRGSSNAAKTPVEGLQGYKRRQIERTDRVATQGDIKYGQINGAPDAVMEYQSTKASPLPQ